MLQIDSARKRASQFKQALEGKRARMKIISSIMVILILSACAEPEASHHMYDSNIYARFIEVLDKEDVDYRVADEFAVFYPVSESAKVREIASKVIAEYHTGCGGSFTTIEKQQAIEVELAKRDIPFRVVELDEGPHVVCPVEYQKAFSEAFQVVLRGASID